MHRGEMHHVKPEGARGDCKGEGLGQIPRGRGCLQGVLGAEEGPP